MRDIEARRIAPAHWPVHPLDDDGSVTPSYYLGEVGILLMMWRLGGSAAVADRLYAAVRSNIEHPTPCGLGRAATRRVR